jgi:hypothetical protein
MLNCLAHLVKVDRHAAPVAGPRAWWAIPLNVEALALESVQCALTAANAVGWDHVTEVRAELVAATSTRSRISESAAQDHPCSRRCRGTSAAPTAGCVRTRTFPITQPHSAGHDARPGS